MPLWKVRTRFHKPDWGLQIDNPAHRVREHACLRLQAALAGQFGLRELLAATTNFRKYYDALPRRSVARRTSPPQADRPTRMGSRQNRSVATPLQDALRMTAQIAAAVAAVAPARFIVGAGQTSVSRTCMDRLIRFRQRLTAHTVSLSPDAMSVRSSAVTRSHRRLRQQFRRRQPNDTDNPLLCIQHENEDGGHKKQREHCRHQ